MFVKVRFTSTRHGATAGLVLEGERRAMSATWCSRFFPNSEYAKLQRFERSPEYATWAEAFAHDFDA